MAFELLYPLERGRASTYAEAPHSPEFKIDWVSYELPGCVMNQPHATLPYLAMTLLKVGYQFPLFSGIWFHKDHDSNKRYVLCSFVSISSHSPSSVLSVVTAPPAPMFHFALSEPHSSSHLYMLLIKTEKSPFPLTSM